MDEQLIEFHANDIVGLPAPYPAVRGVPEWFKTMPGEIAADEKQRLTVKQCVPFLDAMISGFIIPLSGDLVVTVDAAGNFDFDAPHDDAAMEFHDKAQVAGTPLASSLIVKFLNPWTILTPPGYSTLFVAPLNQVSLPFSFFSGVVATDVFYTQVHFPAACLMRPGTQCTLKRGTPLMQAMPFKRENWRSELRVADQQRVEEVRVKIQDSDHVYRDEIHKKRIFR